ncbi:MAG: RdgB/HAM1 family non-canonical purine NTP pyrophosphatase [Methylococcaceae bacterium]|nr:RdgB/HAM1 family non-canonical purine NTP pyrophosphatase [Methylococcaceae bacterium]
MKKTNKPQIILASNNQGKIREIQFLLPDYEIIPQSEVVQTEAEETGLTFVENALLKARHAAQHCHLPVIADDSGLAVDALDGEPGIYSARYAGIGANDKDNNDRLLLELTDVPFEERTARFICLLVMLDHAADPVPRIAQGVWEGRILFHPQGANGFGYDPLFWVPSHHCSSAELPPEVKNSLSHRGQALRQLASLLKK